MLLKCFTDPSLAHMSYLVGCQRTGEAVVIDPGRDVDAYLQAAAREGLRITGAAETHIHADYVSGVHELSARTGATALVSDAGPADWKYAFASRVPSQLLRDGDVFRAGGVEFGVWHTPGHTPESVSFTVTDRGGGARAPMGIFTGDFVFVGAVGRPDLLEAAVGVTGAADASARDLYRSVQRFKTLPDHLQVWPAHGAGSACGKGLGAVPSSTVGYEKLQNPALQIADEAAFVRYILAEQPEVPPYFAVMKRVNREGPVLIGDRGLPPQLDVTALAGLARTGAVLDLAPPQVFGEGHVPGTLNVPAGMLGYWAGWLLDVRQPVHLITTGALLPEATRVLRKIGVDDVRGWFDREAVVRAGLATQSCPAQPPAGLKPDIDSGSTTLLDVRARTEWVAGHIPAAQHAFLGRLPQLARNYAGRRVIVHCLAEGRSAVAAGILQAAGVDVVRMAGGITAWQAAGYPVVSGD